MTKTLDEDLERAARAADEGFVDPVIANDRSGTDDPVRADLRDHVSDRELSTYRRLLSRRFRRSCRAEVDRPTGYRHAAILYVEMRATDAELARRGAILPRRGNG